MSAGTITVTRMSDPILGERLRIEQADPWAQISGELLAEIAGGSPWAEVDSDVLRIWDDFGAEFTYRIGRYDHVSGNYEIAWPD